MVLVVDVIRTGQEKFLPCSFAKIRVHPAFVKLRRGKL